jgi:mannan endo-1,4-beta-mannosidase
MQTAMRIRKTIPSLLSLALAVALIAALLPITAAAAKPHKPTAHAKKKQRPAKQRPLYWGAWIGDQLTGEEAPWDMSAVSQFEGVVGKGLSLLALGSPFADCNTSPCKFFEFPTEAMNNVHNYGAIPFFNWASQATSSDPSGATNMPDFQLSDVIAGTYDSYIREFAEAARNWGHSFFLRYDWEMNGNWFPWGEGINGNNPGEFVAAWRHVHDIFASVGATNATWVWCPYAEVDRHFADLAPLYPGDDYVDWTCMDGFNWGANPTNPHSWKSFNQIFSPTYGELVKKIAPSKPIVLAEMASTGRGRAKAKWINDMFKELRTKYRRIRGLIWFDQIDRGVDWPLETSPAAARAFAKGVHKPGFKPNGQAAVVASPIRPPR